ncbi:MAG: hypothetical protein RLZZ297_855 [Chloroflexota bacterium]|jgi:phosphatidylserine/phosphatidylglycerophosphate/cardiolipin synthase-like enzyme
MTRRRQTLTRREWWLLLGILLLILAYQIATSPDSQPDAAAVPVPPTATTGVGAPPTPTTRPSERIQIFLTTPDLVYPDVASERPTVPVLTAFLADIAAARERIDIAVFDIDLAPLGDALVAAQRRGVAVRLVYDDENLSDARVAKLIGKLQDAGVTVRSDQREPFMHEKTAVFDTRIVWTGSWNMTANDTYRNNNNMVRIESPAMARGFVAEADQLVAGLFGVHKAESAPQREIRIGKRQVAWHFSPQDSINRRVVAQIDAAVSDIAFMAFSYTDPAIARAMVRAQKRGVTVHGVMEKQNSAGTGSAYDTLLRGKVDIVVDGNCYIMHHKTIIIDDATVITGSYNFTKSAEQSNDESLIVLSDPASVAVYRDEYARVRTQADAPTACAR